MHANANVLSTRPHAKKGTLFKAKRRLLAASESGSQSEDCPSANRSDKERNAESADHGDQSGSDVKQRDRPGGAQEMKRFKGNDGEQDCLGRAGDKEQAQERHRTPAWQSADGRGNHRTADHGGPNSASQPRIGMLCLATHRSSPRWATVERSVDRFARKASRCASSPPRVRAAHDDHVILAAATLGGNPHWRIKAGIRLARGAGRVFDNVQ